MAGKKDQQMPFFPSPIDMPETVNLQKSKVSLLLNYDKHDLVEKLNLFARETKLPIKAPDDAEESSDYDWSDLKDDWDLPEVPVKGQPQEESIFDLLDARGKYMQLEKFPQLADGTIRLINFIIYETLHAGRNFDTLMFLDKSARPGAYLFSQTWNELSQRSLIPSGVKKPDIKFLNYSAFDFQNIRSSAKALLSMHFNGKFGSNIMVVDESWASGSSTRGAMALIDQLTQAGSGSEGKVVIGVPNFPDFPEWYHSVSFSPITEMSLEIRVEAAHYLEQLDESQLLELLNLTALGEEEFASSSQVNRLLKSTRGDKLANQIVSDSAYIETNRGIYFYLKSAGGLLSVPADKWATFNNSQSPDKVRIKAHRRLLSKLASYTADHCELKTSQGGSSKSSSGSGVQGLLKKWFS